MLTGRVVILTGASRGLGAEIAAAFVQAGADVALIARPSPELSRTAERLGEQRVVPRQRVLAIPADLRQPESAGGLVERVVTELGGLDILVNNAAITGPIGPLVGNDWDAWQTTITVNLLAPVAMMRAAVPAMQARGWGKIVNLSGGGATGPRPHFSAYAAAKAALVRVTETLASELAGSGIDVNAVAPGAMNTRMLDDVLSAGRERVGESAYRQALAQREDGGSSPSRAAALVLWLASPQTDGITGRLISAVWDTWAELPNRRAELADSDIYTLRRISAADRGKNWDSSK
jgi:3-oxoacyl-[acyl-carrier protein] reductase